jgi:lipoxygenase homology domain-containing protein 1
MGAGTDSNVFLILYGEKGQSGKLRLKNSTTNANPFEKGKKDTFKVITSNIGDINKINISHDGSGPGAGWYVESIQVNNLTNNKSV